MSNRIKDLEVTTPKLATGAVTTPKIADNAVTADKIKDGAVKTAKIGEKQVTGEKIADRAITTAKIVDGAITGSKIADGAVTADKISDGVLGRPLTPPVATTEIADGAVSEPKLANNSVTTDKVKDGAITGAKIAANTITQGDLAANSVGTGEIKDAAVTNPKMVDGAVTPVKLSAVDAPADGEIPAYNQAQAKFEWKPAAGVSRPLVPPIATAEIADGAVTSDKLQATSVTTAKIADGAVTVPKMEDRFTLNSNLLVFSNLSGASVPNTEIDLSSYVPAGTKYAVVVMTHAGANTILYGYKAQFYTKPTVDPAPLYRLDTAQKDFTNYLTVLVPLDSNRKFVTSVYRDGVTTAAELYLMGYIR